MRPATWFATSGGPLLRALENAVVAVFSEDDLSVLPMKRHSVGFVDVRLPHAALATDPMGMETGVTRVVTE